ncbi:hypothetical protein V8C86DRAFT_2722609, partial [Haematococcus lacustris]
VRASLLVLACRAATTQGVSSWSQHCLPGWIRKAGTCSRGAREKARQVRGSRLLAPSCMTLQAMSSSSAGGRSSSLVAGGGAWPAGLYPSAAEAPPSPAT